MMMLFVGWFVLGWCGLELDRIWFLDLYTAPLVVEL